MSSPRALRAAATENAQTQTTSEAAKSNSATTTATGVSSTPTASGSALSANSPLLPHDARMIERPGTAAGYLSHPGPQPSGRSQEGGNGVRPERSPAAIAANAATR